jgi:hypothetical protein
MLLCSSYVEAILSAARPSAQGAVCPPTRLLEQLAAPERSGHFDDRAAGLPSAGAGYPPVWDRTTYARR